jgi:hypothetical protein
MFENMARKSLENHFVVKHGDAGAEKLAKVGRACFALT